MIEIFRGYVATKDKKPLQKFKGVEKLPTLDEVSKLDEYAGILNDEFMVMDVDDPIDAIFCTKLACRESFNVRMIKTSRGVHLVFKKPNFEIKGTTHEKNAFGIEFDIRVGVNQYIVCKNDGKLREILQDFDETKPITEFPKEFAPCKCEHTFIDMVDGSGRNGALFSHIASLYSQGYEIDEIKHIVRLINEELFKNPLAENEVNTILRDDSFKNLKRKGNVSQFIPKEQTDLEIASLFANNYKDEVRYNEGLGWLSWNGKCWVNSEAEASRVYYNFTKKLLDSAKNELFALYKNGNIPSKDEAKRANANLIYAKKLNDGGKITSILKIIKNLLTIDSKELDKASFELNTPIGIVDLRTGAVRDHDASAMCTKMTLASPTDGDSELWNNLLKLVTLDDLEYINYLQVLCGSFLIGKVYNESLIIAQGGGANGKSTLFNVIAKVLGDYSGKIPAESLTTRAKNVKVDLAELFGKRFVLASETEEGQRLSNQMLKQIASTDSITAEKKYHDPFTFEPSHSALLYTNFLPSLGSLDNGTKRRIIICPFKAEITNPEKDYAERLYNEASGVILKWLIEGAKKYIDAKYNLPKCKVVDEAKDGYIKDNDWLGEFIESCCTIGPNEKQLSNQLYSTYKDWCDANNEYTRSVKAFSQALQLRGFIVKKTNKGNQFQGISIDPTKIENKGNSTFL